MSEYEKKTYSIGFAVMVTPEDRGADVLHFLSTGCLLGGRSLEGVTWEEIPQPPEYSAALARAMEKTKA